MAPAAIEETAGGTRRAGDQPTPAQVERYLADDGISCLCCESLEIAADRADADAGEVHYAVHCHACGRIWVDARQLVDMAVPPEESDHGR